jgi:hypothetical protein
MVRRAGIETCERDRVAPTDSGLGFLASQFEGFAVLDHARFRVLAHPADDCRGSRDALHVRLSRLF